MCLVWAGGGRTRVVRSKICQGYQLAPASGVQTNNNYRGECRSITITTSGQCRRAWGASVSLIIWIVLGLWLQGSMSHTSPRMSWDQAVGPVSSKLVSISSSLMYIRFKSIFGSLTLGLVATFLTWVSLACALCSPGPIPLTEYLLCCHHYFYVNIIWTSAIFAAFAGPPSDSDNAMWLRFWID